MKRKFLIISISFAVVICLSSLFLYFVTKKDKPTYQPVTFEITAHLKPWQTLFVKSYSDYIPCLKTGDVYTASLKKPKNSLLRYTFVLGDEWGNTYSDAALDVNGERLSRDTFIKDTAIFTQDLSGYRDLTVEFTLTATVEGEIYLGLDSKTYPMTKTEGKNEYTVTLIAGIGYHSCQFYLYKEGNYIAETAQARQITVSKNSTSFFETAQFVMDTSRNMTLNIKISTVPASLYLFLEEGATLIKAQLFNDFYIISYTIQKDCAFSIFLSTTEDESGISYDAVFTDHTKNYKDLDEINIQLP